MYSNSASVIARKADGYSHTAFAKAVASWTVYDYFHGAFSPEKLRHAHSVMEKPVLARLVLDEPIRFKKELMQTAKAYGADLVGIARRDDRWTYSHDIKGNRITIPDSMESAIVIAIAMDPEEIRRSPAFAASFATGIAYSKMACCIACLAEYIRYLGYQAIPMGNDTALSIPLAVDAGLGELGRNGLLVTSRYGPCVRLCKVFTDLPLAPDEPVAFGVQQVCRDCNRCAEACEADAIQTDPEPSFRIECPSNNRGIYRWAVNHDRCYSFWIENGSDCSNCIAACPFLEQKA